MGNGAKSVTLFTSTGFASVTVPQYVAAVKNLQPDVAIPLADFLHTSQTPKSKKLIKMVERTEEWVDDFLQQVQGREGLETLGVSVFAPILPVELPIQWDYLRHLAEDVFDDLSGLAVYNANILPELERYEPLMMLPHLSMDQPASPHAVLRQVSLGIDICSLSFINIVSDSGVALTFEFPPPAVDHPQPLGTNMWSPEHSKSLRPLADGCQCSACACHHRAYLQHLLNAKEMLGWNLLQIHNHHIMDKFFAGIRSELSKGVAQFEASRRAFSVAYDAEFPSGTGERPRARGYHFKAEAGQDKINKSSWAAELNGQAAA